MLLLVYNIIVQFPQKSYQRFPRPSIKAGKRVQSCKNICKTRTKNIWNKTRNLPPRSGAGAGFCPKIVLQLEIHVAHKMVRVQISEQLSNERSLIPRVDGLRVESWDLPAAEE